LFITTYITLKNTAPVNLVFYVECQAAGKLWIPKF